MNGSVEAIKSEKKRLLTHFLHSNLSRYETLFACNPESIFMMDLEGHLVQVNPAFERLTEFGEEESLRLKLQFLFPIENVNKVFHHFHKACFGEFQNFDCIMKSKSGQLIDLNVTIVPISVDDQIVGVCAVAKDISQLKRKKEEARKMEIMHHLLTDNVLDIIISTSLSGEIQYVSPSCEHILGYVSDELIRQNLFSLLHTDDFERAFQDRKKVLNEHVNGRSSYRVAKKNGEIIWVEMLCKPIIDPDTQHVLEIVSVIRDITERIKAEEDLKSRKKAFRDLIEHSPDAVVIVNEEKILFINETGIRLLGATSSEEITSKHVLDFIHPTDYPKARKRMKSVMDGETTDFIEYKINRLDGTVLHAEIKSIPTVFHNQMAQHTIIRDISERKKTQELILNSEKLNVAGQLAAGIAHEVRNPLTAIKGFLQLMENKIENHSYFGIIQSEIDRIELILSELLVLAKPQEMKFELENIITLMENVKTLIDTQAIMNGVQIKTLYDHERFMIRCDKNQLKQVFINFMKNAIEAMPKGGVITVEMKRHSEDKVKLIFKDTGSGMPQHVLKRIGEPFFSTKEGGTGLGIMISKQIIENHNGDIHFWSDQKGTMIELILPMEN